MANKIVPQTLNSSGAYDKLITAISSGGTGAESESAAVKNLISGLTSTSPASDDLIPFQDVSSGGAGKTTLSALASALQSVRGYAKIQAGSYVGTGTYGAKNPCSLTFDFVPSVIMILGGLATDKYYIYNGQGSGANDYYGQSAILLSEVTTSYQQYRGLGICGYFTSSGINFCYGKKSSDGKTFYWYSNSDKVTQYNDKTMTYWYMGIG